MELVACSVLCPRGIFIEGYCMKTCFEMHQILKLAVKITIKKSTKKEALSWKTLRGLGGHGPLGALDFASASFFIEYDPHAAAQTLVKIIG